jgi:hypothetical protein
MLMREITVNWAEWLVSFINKDAAEENPITYGKRNEALRARAAETVLRIVRNEINPALRESIESSWLERSGWEPWPMNASLTFDEDGRLVVTGAQPKTMVAMAAITIAELVSADSPVEIHECGLSTCPRLFVNVKNRAGRPRKCCSDTHQNTFQTLWARESPDLRAAEFAEAERLRNHAPRECSALLLRLREEKRRAKGRRK